MVRRRFRNYHQINASGVRSREKNESLLHATAYDTLNQLPLGERIIPLDIVFCGAGTSSASTNETAIGAAAMQVAAPRRFVGNIANL